MRSARFERFRHAAAICLLVCLGWLGAMAATAEAQGMSLEAAHKLALDLVNASRAERQLPPLRLDPMLSKAAQSHAEDMYKRNFYSHNTPEGKTPADRFQAAGGSKWLLTAENISRCEGCRTPLQEFLVRQWHEGWMNSPGHRANILRKGLDRFGYGITVDKSGKVFAVQTFAGPGTPSGGATADGKPASETEQLEIIAARINEKRRSAGVKPLEISPGLVATARNFAPASGDASFAIRRADDMFGAIPKAEKEKWQNIARISAQCGGCGVQISAGDIKVFASQWLGDAKTTKMLLDKEFTHFGLTVAADGNGRKMAIGVLGGSAH